MKVLLAVAVLSHLACGFMLRSNSTHIRGDKKYYVGAEHARAKCGCPECRLSGNHIEILKDRARAMAEQNGVFAGTPRCGSEAEAKYKIAGITVAQMYARTKECGKEPYYEVTENCPLAIAKYIGAQVNYNCVDDVELFDRYNKPILEDECKFRDPHELPYSARAVMKRKTFNPGYFTLPTDQATGHYDTRPIVPEDNVPELFLAKGVDRFNNEADENSLYCDVCKEYKCRALEAQRHKRNPPKLQEDTLKYKPYDRSGLRAEKGNMCNGIEAACCKGHGKADKGPQRYYLSWKGACNGGDTYQRDKTCCSPGKAKEPECI